MTPNINQLTPDIDNPSSIAKYFRNIPSGVPFNIVLSNHSLDYSLQLAFGIDAAKAELGQLMAMSAKTENRASQPAAMTSGQNGSGKASYLLTSMEEEIPTQLIRKTADTTLPTKRSSDNTIYWILGAVGVAGVGFIIYRLIRKIYMIGG